MEPNEQRMLGYRILNRANFIDAPWITPRSFRRLHVRGDQVLAVVLAAAAALLTTTAAALLTAPEKSAQSPSVSSAHSNPAERIVTSGRSHYERLDIVPGRLH